MKRRFVSILLAVVMLFSMIPAVSAAEYDGTVGNSNVSWSFDPLTGKLTVSGYGDCHTFTSAYDQPWAHLRDQITEVWFADMETLSINDLSYWFDGCTSLTMAEIPYTTPVIGTRAFADCPNLTVIQFYYYDADSFYIAPGAFYTDALLDTTLRVITEQQKAVLNIAAYDWEADNRYIHMTDAYGLITLTGCSLSDCSCSSCSWYYSYSSYNSSKHDTTINCTNCSAAFPYSQESHSFGSNGECTDCGYYNSSYDTSCSHSSISRTWDTSCRWTEYCDYCGEEVSSGISHGPYNYGSWRYYSSLYHQRSYTCSYGDSGTYYETEQHSTSKKYNKYSDTQHAVFNYCSKCSSTVGSTSHANHSFAYGSWVSYSETQHRRTKSCSLCGYSTYEYGDHADSNSDGSCDSCGYEMSRFSVTVPVSLNLTVSEFGEVYAASNAEIINNSTGSIKVSDVTIITASSWTLVPYSRNMASEHVDSKQIGFSINNAVSTAIGNSESLLLNNGWTIVSGDSLALNYDAVVSAMSEPVSEQVLSIIFTVKWA